MPEWYRERPPEVRGDEFYLLAFSRLGTCRQFPGTGFGPIPWTAARDYAIEHGLSPSMRTVFCDVILLLDAAYRERMREKQAREQKRAAAAAEQAEKLAAAGAGAGGRRK